MSFVTRSILDATSIYRCTAVLRWQLHILDHILLYLDREASQETPCVGCTGHRGGRSREHEIQTKSKRRCDLSAPEAEGVGVRLTRKRQRTLVCPMYVCRKMNNSRAQTGHQRGMGGRGTDDDDTHERHTDTNKLTRHTASWLPHTLSWRTHNSRPHPPCRPPQHSKVPREQTRAQQTTDDRK